MFERPIRFAFFGIFLLLLGFPAFAANKKEVAEQIRILNEKIMVAGDKGDLEGATKIAQQVYDLSVKTYGEKKPETAKAMNNLANLYMFAGKNTEAEALYKKAILIEVEENGKDSIETADSYFNLGVAYAMQKKFNAARPLLNDVLKIRTDKLGADHPATQKVRDLLSEMFKDEHPNAETIS